MTNSNKKRLISFICAILILSYAFIIFLSHSHTCSDTTCEICFLANATKGALLFLLLLCSIYGVSHLYSVAPCSDAYRLSYRENTPVGQKVKLSN